MADRDGGKGEAPEDPKKGDRTKSTGRHQDRRAGQRYRSRLQDTLGCLFVAGIVAYGAFSVFAGVNYLRNLGSTWIGHVYPEPDNLTLAMPVGEFSSLETCVTMSLQLVDFLGGGVYECSLNCQRLYPELDDSVFVCEETQGTAP